MSKRRLVITAVVVEGRTHAEVATQYGMSRSWVTRLVARYNEEGDTAFEARSRRPHTSPTRVADVVTDLIVNLRAELTKQGLDAGPHTVAWHLREHHDLVVSISTIRRRLLEAGLITPEPPKKPRSSYIRFEAELPNETWQSDFTHYRLATGADTEILVWLDDHSRYALSVTAHQPVTGTAVLDTFTKTARKHGLPASVLTDNGLVYTVRFAGGRGGRNHLETTLANLNITQKHSRPNHPTTCGKVERFHQTLKKWLDAQPATATITDLQHHLDRFVDEYNHRRPHRSLGPPAPAAAYHRLPKATPAESATGTHYRIRHDRIHDNGTISLRRAGRMHHIGIGRAHAHTNVIILIADLDIRVINHTTGQLLRALTLDPNRGYQPHPKT